MKRKATVRKRAIKAKRSERARKYRESVVHSADEEDDPVVYEDVPEMPYSDYMEAVGCVERYIDENEDIVTDAQNEWAAEGTVNVNEDSINVQNITVDVAYRNEDDYVAQVMGVDEQSGDEINSLSSSSAMDVTTMQQEDGPRPSDYWYQRLRRDFGRHYRWETSFGRSAFASMNRNTISVLMSRVDFVEQFYTVFNPLAVAPHGMKAMMSLYLCMEIIGCAGAAVHSTYYAVNERRLYMSCKFNDMNDNQMANTREERDKKFGNVHNMKIMPDEMRAYAQDFLRATVELRVINDSGHEWLCKEARKNIGLRRMNIDKVTKRDDNERGGNRSDEETPAPRVLTGVLALNGVVVLPDIFADEKGNDYHTGAKRRERNINVHVAFETFVFGWV